MILNIHWHWKHFALRAKKLKEDAKKYDVFKKDLPGFNVSLLEIDAKAMASDSNKVAREKKWVDALKKDFYLQEAAFVIGDMK